MSMPARSRMQRRVERGAVATIVAILLGGGVLLGCAALAIDVGNLMFERRQLQNAADATAMKLAAECAKATDIASCDDDVWESELTSLSMANASDNSAQLDRRLYPQGQCGRVPGAPGMPECTTTGDISDLGECTPLPQWLADSADIPYVETYTLTETPEGGSFLLPYFGAGDGSEVAACARAVWGSPGTTGTTFPLVIRECDWNATTENGTSFAPSPPYSPPPATPPASPTSAVPSVAADHVTHVLAHVTGNASNECGSSMYTPGGFGWLDEDDLSEDCTATYNADGTAPGGTGAAPTDGCKQDGMQQWLGKEVMIPVFTSASGTGAGTLYTLAGVSSFYFAGWQDMQTAQPNRTYSVYTMPANLPGETGDHMCEYQDDNDNWKKGTCIWGWFTSPILPVGTVGTGVPSRGPEVIQMVG